MAHPAHYREAHPFIFVMTHWINLVSIVALTISGFYIHYPFLPGLMSVARGMHFFFMFVLLINLAVRIIGAFTVKSATRLGSREVDTDIKNWLPQKLNRGQMWPWLKYYLFLKKEHPIGAKYGVLQKLAYLFTVPLTLAAAYTGFAIWGPTMDWGFFIAGTDAVGGPMHMRIIHYYIMWGFIVFTAIHVYLANIEGTDPSKLIFKWQETEGLQFDAEGKVIGGKGH